LAEPAEEMEQKLSAGLGKGQISEFVQNDEVHLGQMLGEPPLRPVAGLDFEAVDKVDHVVEAPTGAGSDAAPGDCDGQMGLAGAGQDSVTMPGVRRSRSGSTIRFILDAARWCRSRSGGGSQARITWSWFSQTARSLWSRPGWRRQWLALPLSPRALGYRSVGSSSCAHDSIRF